MVVLLTMFTHWGNHGFPQWFSHSVRNALMFICTDEKIPGSLSNVSSIAAAAREFIHNR